MALSSWHDVIDRGKFFASFAAKTTSFAPSGSVFGIRCSVLAEQRTGGVVPFMAFSRPFWRAVASIHRGCSSERRLASSGPGRQPAVPM
jgi:hypothetical protein